MVVVSVTVSVEPKDSEPRFSSRMVWRDALEHQPICSILTVSESWLVIGSVRG